MTPTEHPQHIEAAETIKQLRAQVEALTTECDNWKESAHAWIVQNGRGGWIDNLRNSELARTIERDAALALAAERLVDAEQIPPPSEATDAEARAALHSFHNASHFSPMDQWGAESVMFMRGALNKFVVSRAKLMDERHAARQAAKDSA